MEEKKWFVYVSDHHEGPLTIPEIGKKISDGEVTPDGYVWTEGMSDWQPMSQISAFSVPVAEPSPAVPLAPTTVAEEGPSLTSSEGGPSEPAALPAGQRSGPSLTLVAARALSKSEPEPATVQKPAIQKTQAQKKWMPVILIFLVLASAAALGFSNETYRQSFVTRSVGMLPALGKWLSPIPPLNDVSPEEYALLKAGALLKDDKSATAAIAPSKADLLSPSFYVSSGLPDGAQFDITLEGVPETLLNQLKFFAQVKATLTHRLGKSQAVRFPDGRPIPRGEYLVYLSESEFQPDDVKAALSMMPAVEGNLAGGKRIAVRRTLFLGGPRDESYISRLKDFLTKVKEKSAMEMAELKQFAALLEGQLESTGSTFERLKKGKSGKLQLKTWDDFHGKWAKLSAQMDETLRKLTPESLANDWFYGTLYGMMRQVGEDIAKLHALQDTFFRDGPKGAASQVSLETQLAEKLFQTKAAVATLKEKIDLAEKQPLSRNGIPKFETETGK